LQKVIYV
jgi:hypothetical protein